MRYLCTLTRCFGITSLLLLSFFAHGAQAQELRTGHGFICDTEAQLREIVRLTKESRNFEASAEKVNNGTDACGFATIVFFKGETVGGVWTSEGRSDIVKITIIANLRWYGAEFVAPLVQFTLLKAEGEDA